MPNHNKVQLIGNLTRDPQMRKVSDQASVCQFGLATSRTYRDRHGDTQDETTFVDLEAWGRSGEIIYQHLAKGRPVFVEGRLRLDQWTDPDGQKRSKLKVVVEHFQFLDGKPAGADAADTDSTAPEEAA